MLTISRFSVPYTRVGLVLALSILLSSYPLSSTVVYLPLISLSESQPAYEDIRGIWVQARLLTNQATKENIDRIVQRVEAAHLNTIFVGVFHQGQLVFEVDESSEGSQHSVQDFDPLAYLISEAHSRNIEVHAWFSVGKVGNKDTPPILAEHPEWALVGPDGNTINWLNFSHPEVRQFLVEMIVDVVDRYGVDGVHLDYTRYPGPDWGFDPYTIEAFTEKSGIDLNILKYSDLPAYGIFSGNPLANPGSANVLAAFSNGVPAVVLNQYGEGEVVLLNWRASQRNVAVGTEILQRSLQRLVDEDGQVYLLRSETNAEVYGYSGFEAAIDWLEDLGWSPVPVKETEIQELAHDAVLVIPNVYLISPEVASQMADFVNQGGGMIFVDGPTRSIDLEEIQEITGMQSRGRFFSELLFMEADGEHPLIPTSEREANWDLAEEWDEQWREFRREGINQFLRDLYRVIKADFPNTAVSVTITSNQEYAIKDIFQDWPTWLEGKMIDFLVPRAYVGKVSELQPVLDAWEPVMRTYDQIIFGLILYYNEKGSNLPKNPNQLIMEIQLALATDANGFALFDFDNLTDEQIAALDSNFAILNQIK